MEDGHEREVERAVCVRATARYLARVDVGGMRQIVFSDGRETGAYVAGTKYCTILSVIRRCFIGTYDVLVATQPIYCKKEVLTIRHGVTDAKQLQSVILSNNIKHRLDLRSRHLEANLSTSIWPVRLGVISACGGGGSRQVHLVLSRALSTHRRGLGSATSVALKFGTMSASRDGSGFAL